VRREEATILDDTGAPISGEIIWESSDKAIASVVGSRGEIRGVAPGTTTVVATAKNLKAEVKVEVMKPGPADLQVSKALVEVKVGKTAKVEGIPVDESAKRVDGFVVSYESDDSDVATVAADGTVTGVAAGEAILTVSAGDKTVTIKVVVK
jgi:uncharacterized protein YjdB